MKKLLSVILVLSMILGSVSSVGVFALDEDVAISLVTKKAEYVEGTPSTLAAVELSENPGISNLMLVVYYKADELKLSENTDKAFKNSIFSPDQSGCSSELSGTSRSIKKYLPEGAVASEYKGFTVDLCGEWNSEAGAYEDMTADGIVIEIPFEAASFVAGAEYKYTVVVTGAENGAGVSYAREGLSFEGSVLCLADEELGKYSDFTLFLSPETVKIESRKKDTFKVDLRVDANPGIWNMRFYLVYPEETALKSIENGTIFPDDTFSTLYKNRPLSDPEQLDTFKKAIAGERIPQIGYASAGVNYKFSAADKVADGNGVLLTLEFEMPKNASYEELFDIRVLYAEGDIFGPPASSDFENFAPEAVGTKVTVGCDHSETVEGYKEPTCGEDGYNGTVCAFCNKLYSGEILPATEEHTPDGEATCVRGVYCIDCKKLMSSPSGIHTLKSGSSCVSEPVCALCGMVMAEAPGHVRDEKGVCTVCGAFSTSHPYPNEQWNKNTFITHKGAESITITFSKQSKLDSYGDYVSVYDKGGVLIGKYSGTQMASKTVTVPGDIVRVCFYSNYGGTDYGFDIESVTWEYPEFFGDFGYIETNLGKEIEIINYKGSDEAIVIPSEINGKPVTSIGSGALASYHFLKNVEIPSSVKEIGDRAFYNCSKLENVIINSSVEKIGSYAFSECDKFVFFVVPEGVTTIGEGAFSYCSGLKMLLIPSTVKTIGDDIVWQSTKMEKILFSGTDDQWRFKECTLVYEDSSEGYTFYPDVYYNCAYSDDCMVYQMYPDSKTAMAYCYLGNETEIHIASQINGNAVTSIGSSLSLYKKDIEKIHIPKSIITIRNNAFSNCTVLNTVYFYGNYAEWSKIGIGSNNSVLDTAAVYCNYLMLTDEFALGWDEDTQSVVISKYIGNEANVVIPSEIDGHPVTIIEENAFAQKTGLESISIPSGITTIRKSAFSGCTELSAVYIEDIASWCGISFENNNSNPLVYADDLFLNGERLTQIIIPDGVTSIGERAFVDYKKLEEISIPKSVTSIGEYAFSGCTELSGVYIEDMSAWCSISFSPNYANPLSYAKNLYLNGELVTYLIIPNEITEINSRAFYNCTSIKKVLIPKFLKEVGDYAFSDCTEIRTVYYPGEINEWSLIENTGNSCLTDATVVYNYGTSMQGFYFTVNDLNNTITITDYISDSTDMVIPSSYNGYIVRYMDFYAFEGREDITSVVIPETMWVIPEGAFKDCKNLERVTIKEGVRDIGDYAFSGCTSLTEVVIPEGVEYIFTYAFNECTSLKSVSLPYTLMTVEYKAFYMCDAIDRVTYNGSEERWNNITVASGNAALERAGIVFAETPDTGDNEVRFSAVGELSEGGDTVTVKVYVDENPGTWCMRFNVNYNSEYFTFLSAENGRVYLDSETAGRNLGDCYSYYAENTDVYENNSKTGLILTLTFAVAEGIPGGEYSFNVGFPDDVEGWFFDVNTLRGRTVSCTSQAQVTVEGEEAVITGDLSGDGEINAKDSNLFKRAVAGELRIPADSPEFAIADLSGDGELNAKDANLIKQIIAGEIQI